MTHTIEPEETIGLLREKNLILINVLRDIIENEVVLAKIDLDENFRQIDRILINRETRRREIIGEIQDILYRHALTPPL